MIVSILINSLVIMAGGSLLFQHLLLSKRKLVIVHKD